MGKKTSFLLRARIWGNVGQTVTAADNLFPCYARFPHLSSGQGFFNTNFKQCLNEVQVFGWETNWPDIIWCWLAVGNSAQMWGTLDCFILGIHYQSIDQWKTFSHMAKECISYQRLKEPATDKFTWIWKCGRQESTREDKRVSLEFWPDTHWSTGLQVLYHISISLNTCVFVLVSRWAYTFRQADWVWCCTDWHWTTTVVGFTPVQLEMGHLCIYQTWSTTLAPLPKDDGVEVVCQEAQAATLDWWSDVCSTLYGKYHSVYKI